MDARLRALCDAMTVAVVPAAAVDLALPWFTHITATSATTDTGWHGLSDRTEGTGWFLIVAVVASSIGLLVHRRALRIAAFVVTVLSAAALLITCGTVGRLDDYDVRAGAGVAILLAVLCAAAQLPAVAARGRG